MYLLPLIVTPILSRLYSPEAFGEWGIFSSVLIIANIGVMLGYENAIVRTDSDNIANISCVCFFIALLSSTLIYLVFLLGEVCEIGFFVKFPSSALLYLCLITSALTSIFSNMSNRYERYGIMSIANIVSGSTQALARIMFGSICIVVLNGLIVGTTVSHTIVVVFYVVCLSKILNINFIKKISFRGIVQQLKQYKQFPCFDAPSSLLAFAAFNLPIIILSSYFSKSEIGCYSMIIQLLLLPMSFIGSAMGRVYYRQLAECKDDVAIRMITGRVLKMTAIISILPLMFIALGGDKVIIMFLGKNWITAGNIALCLALWSFPTILTQPLIPLLRIKNKMNILFFCNLLYFVGGIGIILISVLFTKNLYLILLFYSLACSIAKLVLFKNIICLSGTKVCAINKHCLLWGVAVFLLIIRLSFLFIE